MNNLDSELLRTFLAVAETGSITEGARVIGRSQSATSLQIMRLEEVVGRELFDRTGRGVNVSDTGQRLLPVAKEVTGRLDTALRELTADGLRGKLRLAIPDDHGRAKLTRIIAAFAQSHPYVELDVRCSLSVDFPELLAKGLLDLAVYEVETVNAQEEVVYRDPTHWSGLSHMDHAALDPVPVALFDRACWWRDAAIKSLEAANRSYRVVYSSQSVSGVKAAVEAGVAVGLLGRTSIEAPLKMLNHEEGFEPTPVSHLVIGTAEGTETAPIRSMKEAIRQAFRQ